jgi:hypothetical protein
MDFADFAEADDSVNSHGKQTPSTSQKGLVVTTVMILTCSLRGQLGLR